MEIVKPTKNNINEVVKVLNKGGIIICPTDTVYGFLALADNKKAVEKIFKIKKRPKNKPLPIFVKDIKMAKELAEISLEQEKVLKKYWPGKYTFILNAGKKTIALRIPKCKFLNDLIKKINKPLAQTSVNISGQLPMTKIKDIIEVFGPTSLKLRGASVDLIIGAGNLKKSKPSKIIDLTGKKINILRK
jgi:L-threonylcarbamoyladenylate synthase